MRKSHRRIVIFNTIVALVVLCGIGISFGFIGTGRDLPAWTNQTAKELDMDVYYAQGPIAVFVHHGGDPTGGYTFIDNDRKFVLVVKKSELFGLKNEQDVLLCFAEDSGVSCVYEPSADRPLKDLSLIRKKFGLVDFDIDGIHDLRCWYATKKTEAWYEGKWAELVTEEGSRYSRQLRKTGVRIQFNFEKHKWVRKKQ